MTVQDYLLKFRKISSLESLEKLYDHLNYTLTDDQELINMYRAADHRRESWFLAGVCLTSARYRSPSGTMSNKVAIGYKSLIITPLKLDLPVCVAILENLWPPQRHNVLEAGCLARWPGF